MNTLYLFMQTITVNFFHLHKFTSFIFVSFVSCVCFMYNVHEPDEANVQLAYQNIMARAG